MPSLFAFCTLVALLIAGGPLAVGPGAVGPAQAQEPEHLPLRSKPPPRGVRPIALPPYAQRLAVPAVTDADRVFDRTVDEFLLFYFRARPVRATNAGLHDYDALLPETDRDSLAAVASRLDEYLARLGRIEVARLEPARRIDHGLLTNRLRGAILDFRTVRSWTRDPHFYLAIVSEGIQSLLERDYAPIEDRTWNVISRLQKVPGVLRDARKNLENPPRAYTELAIKETAELVSFLANEVPVRVAPLRDPVQGEEFDHHLAPAVGAASDFYDWLRHDLLPRSNGPLALDADAYERRLEYEGGIATPPESLLQRAEAELRGTQLRMEEVARALGPGLSVREALAKLALDAPAARDLVPNARACVEDLGRFVAGHALLAPPHEDLRVVEMPIFLRPTALTSLDPPAVFEPGTVAAHYYLAPPDDRWPSDRQKEYLGAFNPYALAIRSICETVPGRYVYTLGLRNCPSLVRALLSTPASADGWAHYCEQMMLEAGYGGGDARYRLAQLHESLRQVGHCVVGQSIQTRGMTYDDAVSFFEREAYLDRTAAEREARRALTDPHCAVSTPGKWAILDLRAEVRKAEGPAFRLGAFHDRLLACGGTPLAFVRDDRRGRR
jgi:uncharacterized protein (DUF885 family)